MISAIFSIVSGLVSYVLNNKRIKEKDIGDIIREIEYQAFRHWCGQSADSDNHTRAVEIQFLLRELGKKIKKKPKAKSALIEFRIAITSDDFSEPSRLAVKHDSSRARLINKTADDLRKILKIE